MPRFVELRRHTDNDGDVLTAEGSFLLPEWLERVRPHTASPPRRATWHRIVDALTVAGDDRDRRHGRLTTQARAVARQPYEVGLVAALAQPDVREGVANLVRVDLGDPGLVGAATQHHHEP